MKRILICEMKDGTEEVDYQSDYRHPEDEQHMRSSMEREIRDPQSYVQGYRFKWIDEKDIPNR